MRDYHPDELRTHIDHSHYQATIIALNTVIAALRQESMRHPDIAGHLLAYDQARLDDLFARAFQAALNGVDPEDVLAQPGHEVEDEEDE